MVSMLKNPPNFPAGESPLPLGDAFAGGVAPRLLLASRSPRRRTILSDYGLPHDAEHPGFDDAILSPGGITPRQWVASLAYLKASVKAASLAHEPGSVVVLGADTICVHKGNHIGTPIDALDAARILRLLCGGEHEVLTGVALIHLHPGRPDLRHLFVDSAIVRLGELSDEAIAEYVESGAWQGKAGGYNLAERLEAGWPLEYVGDPTTIMGLPMRELVPRLARMGVVSSSTGPYARPGV
jgi:septum formation protein